MIALLLCAACTDAIPSVPSAESPEPTSELQRAAARMQEWLDRLESVELEIVSIANPDDGPLKVTAAAMIAEDTFYFSLYAPLRTFEDQPLDHIETLVLGSDLYIRWYDVDGWLQGPLDDLARRGLGVTGLDRVTTVSWTELDDVSVVRRVWRGRRVWVIEYDADKDELGRFPDLVSGVSLGVNGMPTAAYTIPPGAAHVRIVVDRDSGAPLRTETTQELHQDTGEPSVQIVRFHSTIELTAWNEPLNLPTPEPLLEEDEFWALVHAATEPEVRYRTGDATAWRMVEQAQDWYARRSEVSLVQETRLTVDGRLVTTVTPASPSRSARSELPLSIERLAAFLTFTTWSVTGAGPDVAVLESRLGGEALAALQELAIAVIQNEIDVRVEPALRVRSVERLELIVRLDPNSGAVFDATLSASATTSKGALELETTIAALAGSGDQPDAPTPD